MSYEPKPIDTSQVKLGGDLTDLIEVLAGNAHDVWGRQRLAEGWTWGPERNDTEKKHPNLVPYEQLPESEKDYDRNMVLLTVKAIIALGYRIEKL